MLCQNLKFGEHNPNIRSRPAEGDLEQKGWGASVRSYKSKEQIKEKEPTLNGNDVLKIVFSIGCITYSSVCIIKYYVRKLDATSAYMVCLP